MATIRKDNPETDDPDYTIETDGDGCSVWLIVGEHLLLIDGDRIEVYDPDNEAAIVAGLPVHKITLRG